MKISGKVVADAISKKLKKQLIKSKVQPTLAIILAGDNPASRIYVKHKIKRAQQIGIKTQLLEFSRNQFDDCLAAIQKLNKDKKIHGIIVQYPTYKDWDFDNLISKIDPGKDVDGFRNDSLYRGATALAVWEMLTAFSLLEGFKKTEDFLKSKKIVLLGRGKTAGEPTRQLLASKGFEVSVIVCDTPNPTPKIKNAEIIISATGQKNIIDSSNVQKGAYVVGVGFGREIVDGKSKIYGDINEEDISKIAKLYCPTIGGIGPLTIVSLLRNTIESACRTLSNH
ncbi:bifunctional 5,10-methylenetetrahydrofolate dehydrogenase/5,10-methenyltetrahydrofolate cyclohydrolase [Patescibacteria group bacterium]|nr:bifunctional 5,10-methylenetetrahydrofolate dehydrogenase/5,10-methenyltetrahydrofolate cyclohydrolase [Patescibacteria group bacterium]